jgi:glycosyltransferase involved in cell wall biosynthesis
MPTYNRERFLPMSIGSVRAQTFADWELVVVDDRSTDGTRELVAKMSAEDPRIRYTLGTRKRGPAGARNHGVAESRGRFVALLDSDDQWEEFHLAEAVRRLTDDAAPADVFTANPLRKRWGSGEVVEHDQLDLAAYPGRADGDVFRFDPEKQFDPALRRRLLTTQTIVARREVFERLPFDEDLMGCEDCLFPIQVAAAKFRVVHRQAYHVTYWVHDDNLTNRDGAHAPERMVEVREAFVRLYRRILRDYRLTPDQKAFVEGQLAEYLVWTLGYTTYLPMGRYGRARACFRQGLRLKPLRGAYWRVLVTSYAKQLLGVKS